MADNATNNDTMMDNLARKFRGVKIAFNPKHARMRCMPHTIHLAAIKLLEGIGAVEKSKRATNDNYQDNSSIKFTAEAEREAELVDDDAEDEVGIDENVDAIMYSVPKLRCVIRTIRSSPQRRRDWFKLARSSLSTIEEEDESDEPAPSIQDVLGLESAAPSTAATPAPPTAPATPAEDPSSAPGVKQGSPASPKMLILDARTRWSSTHQMLARAVEFREIINDYTSNDKNDLRKYRLTGRDWEAISIVENWLQEFRGATLEMSSTRSPMLSSTHAIFRTLQSHLRQSLSNLPATCSQRLKDALIAAHQKLSDYYWRFDNESPFYLWAAMLDPRIKYDGLLLDCTDEPGTTEDDLAASRAALKEYMEANYKALEPASNAPSAQAPAATGRISFVARYATQVQRSVDEVDEFFRLPQEDWEPTDPIQWWHARLKIFPRLARMALDILSIPGSAVAVERVFSGGRDTLGIRRANLAADTIRMLMITKQALRLARENTD